ncbi:aminoglycoside phosphotransferase family protein [Pseudooceanicola sp. CBS1P-1]|uniref:Phosphotransferase n=1 Tax=Pseudooceanicola albus TaxID=2692189 RepID=A0A6L7G736_9RHOB|nr:MULTISPECIES: aminoglycoside phosphotransferase family protein [Pseudooceanicola]MBT9385843.1 aminoglycoside phosphotransferase family protein [Pseudooceanicola endophyticus]MXN20074.1 phosphotransferase [Pseudooceanicola albus]
MDGSGAETEQGHERLAQTLRAALPGLGLPQDGWQPLSGGRSNRAWRVATPGGDLVVKLYRPAAASALFPNDARAEAAALRALADTGLAPRLAATQDTSEGSCILYHHLPGPSWAEADLPAPEAAGLLRRLHARPCPPGLRAAPNGSETLRQAIRAQLGHGPDSEALLARLPDDRIAEGPVCFLHGDPVPGNVILTPQGERLIDWQCPAVGDPCLDLALMLSPAMHWLYRGKALDPGTAARIAADYWAGHPDGAARYRRLIPFLQARIAAYCLWRARRGSAPDARAAALEIAALEAATGR